MFSVHRLDSRRPCQASLVIAQHRYLSAGTINLQGRCIYSFWAVWSGSEELLRNPYRVSSSTSVADAQVSAANAEEDLLAKIPRILVEAWMLRASSALFFVYIKQQSSSVVTSTVKTISIVIPCMLRRTMSGPLAWVLDVSARLQR